MDVILARLDPRQLRVYCSDALQQELTKTFELLEQALAASKRAEDVQHASHKLAVQEFQDDSALLQRLEQIDSLRLQLSISIDHIVRGAKGKLPREFSPHLVKNEERVDLGMQSILELSDSSSRASDQGLSSGPATNSISDDSGNINVIDLIAGDMEVVAPVAPSSSRKRKLSVSSTSEQQSQSAASPSVSSVSIAKKFVPDYDHIPIASRLGKCIKSALDCSVDVMKRKVGDRVQGFAMLSSKLAVVIKNLDAAEYAEVKEAMDSVSHLIAIIVNVLVKAKPHAKRQVVIKGLKTIQDVQTKFPEFATLFEKSHASLSKYIEVTFPLSAKETEELKRRIRNTLKEVKAWESGSYSVPDFQEKMRIVKQALDSNCENFIPKKDPTLLELLDLLITRLSGFKESQKQDKRKETLQAWRSEMKVMKSPKVVQEKNKRSKKDDSSSAEGTATTTSQSPPPSPNEVSKEQAKTPSLTPPQMPATPPSKTSAPAPLKKSSTTVLSLSAAKPAEKKAASDATLPANSTPAKPHARTTPSAPKPSSAKVMSGTSGAAKRKKKKAAMAAAKQNFAMTRSSPTNASASAKK